jgi:hypothetical protein
MVSALAAELVSSNRGFSTLEVEGETPGAKAAEIGRIFQRIAQDQMERPRSFEERDAIAHFWGLIGELPTPHRKNSGSQ